jgi:hypothetical protein
LNQTVDALDATTVDPCLGVLPWARFCSTKTAVKINTQFDSLELIPSTVHVTPEDVHEANCPIYHARVSIDTRIERHLTG